MDSSSKWSLVLLVCLFVGLASSGKVFPINIGERGFVSFNNQRLSNSLVYRRAIQPKHALKFTFSNINLGSSKLKIFTRVGSKIKWERIITGSKSQPVHITLHSADLGGVLVPQNTGTFSMAYRDEFTCDHYCEINAANGEHKVKCSQVPDKHHTACLECKASRCFVQPPILSVIIPPLEFGMIYCTWPGFNIDRSCSEYNKEGSVCTFTCKEGSFPGTLGIRVIESKCVATSEDAGSWDKDLTNFCLTQERVIELCLSASPPTGSESCPYDVNEMTELFNEEPESPSLTGPEPTGTNVLGPLPIQPSLIPPPKSRIPLTHTAHLAPLPEEPRSDMNPTKPAPDTGSVGSIPKPTTRTKKLKRRERRRCRPFCRRKKDGEYKFICGIISSIVALRGCKRCRNRGLKCGSG